MTERVWSSSASLAWTGESRASWGLSTVRGSARTASPTTEERDAAEAGVKEIVRTEGRATTTALTEAFDLCLAGIDREMAMLHKGDGIKAMSESYDVRPHHERLRNELAALDRRLNPARRWR